MELYDLYSDLHFYGPYARKDVVSKTKNTVLLGDIVDAANAKKKEVSLARKKIEILTEEFGRRYIYGNHERMGLKNEYFVENGIYFTHGDLESNYEKWFIYRFKEQGAGWFKRNILSFFINEFEDEIDRQPKTTFLIEAARIAKSKGCHTYVAGHFHPKKLIDVKYSGIRIVIVPRGHTLINL